LFSHGNLTRSFGDKKALMMTYDTQHETKNDTILAAVRTPMTCRN